MSEPLAIVGASARAAAASAVRAGFRPVAADLFADADLRRIATATRIAPYPDGFLDWLRVIEPAAWMYTGALENYPELVDQMAWLAPLWGNTGDVLARVRSPWELANALRAAGHLFPETHASPDGVPLDGSWLAKTYRGASGSGVKAWEDKETRRQGDKETKRARQSTSGTDSPCLPVSLSPGLVFQKRIAGVPCAGVFVAADGAATLLGLTRQLVGELWLEAREFQYAGSIGLYPAAEAAIAEVVAIGSTIAREFELVGLFGLDFIVDGDNVWTLEVNPRYTASVEIVERATGIAAIAAHAAAYRGMRVEDTERSAIAQHVVHGKAVLFAKRPVVITEHFAAWAIYESLAAPWPRMADVSLAGTPVAAGRPVLTMFAEGLSAAEVEGRLRDRVAEVTTRLYAECGV